ncbi:MAG: SAM-dependent methyltransferase [Actinomycetota bacterium]
MERPSWAPDDIDTNQPSGARVYDYFLGGAHNFAVDRELANAIASMTPHIGDTMRANRAFLRRAINFLTAAGIDQFLDIGSGIPTVGNVHEVAQQANSNARVVYVDIDPIAVSHSRAMLEGTANTTIIQADARDADVILDHPETQRLLDFSRPVALLILGVLHFIPDEDNPVAVVDRLRQRLTAGSYLALVSVTHENQPQEYIEGQKLSNRTSTPIYLRSREELQSQFGGLPLVDPGLVHLPLWRPDAPLPADMHPERFGALAGIATV